jgi:type I restriction enzyme S subunit
MRPGYKQTEVGVIPEDWEVADIGQVGDKLRPSVKAGPFGSAIKKEMYVASGYKVYGQEQVIRGDHTFGEYFIAPSKFRELESCSVQSGDILLSLVGTAGRSLLVPDEATPGIINPRLVRVSIDQGQVAPEFAIHQFESRIFQDQLLTLSQGGTMGVLNARSVRSVRLVIPALPEQRAIAAALGDVDAAVAGLERLVAKKRDLKQAAMQQLLTGQTRLPGFSGAWEVKRLGEVGRCLRGVTYSADSDLFSNDADESCRLLRANNVQSSSVVLEGLQFVRSDCVSEAQYLQHHDILICMANGSRALVGKSALFSTDDGMRYTFGAFMGCFRTDLGDAIPRFIFGLLQTKHYSDEIGVLLAGSTINNLAPSAVENLEFAIPCIAEQTAIANVLSDMDAELAALQAQLDKTRLIKQAMMQDLLTGRVRLPFQ